MNMKTLLGTAAGLMVATSAYAADLPGDAVPAAVDYVKVCDAFGAGFFYIPGTETCLKLSGRVRAAATYDTDFKNGAVTADAIRFKVDGRVAFDARTASDIGTVRSFFQTDLSGSNLTLGDTFIQVGFLTVGKLGDVANGTTAYGVNDVLWSEFDKGGVGADVMFDKLGGGFYVGASVRSFDSTNNVVWQDSVGTSLRLAGIVGIQGQPWGSADVSVIYGTDENNNLATTPLTADYWGVKASSELKLIDKVSFLLSGIYIDSDLDTKDKYGVFGAVKFAATDSLAIYGGVGETVFDKADDIITAQIGAQYTLAPGLIANAEVLYNDGQSYDDNFSGILRLTRNW
jgi:hypothetical protein